LLSSCAVAGNTGQTPRKTGSAISRHLPLSRQLLAADFECFMTLLTAIIHPDIRKFVRRVAKKLDGRRCWSEPNQVAPCKSAKSVVYCSVFEKSQ
jgi:hypothetical protein